MTYLHKASRCLTTFFGGGRMWWGSVCIFNGHSPFYLNLLHRMRDPMTITGDIMIIMGKQLQVKHFGAALQHIRDLKWWNFLRKTWPTKCLHQCSCFWVAGRVFGQILGHLHMEPMLSTRHSNTSNKNWFSLQQTSSLFCSRDSHRGMVV